MNWNENDAMEWNDVLSETNILICYMPKTELRMHSYDAMNKGKISRVWGKSQPRWISDPDLARFTRMAGFLAGVEEELAGDVSSKLQEIRPSS